MGSAGYEMNCDKTCMSRGACNSGCRGGYLSNTWEYIKTNGITTAECVKVSMHVLRFSSYRALVHPKRWRMPNHL